MKAIAEATTSVEWTTNIKSDDGEQPAVACNSQPVAVEVNKNTKEGGVWYRVGTFNPDYTVNWTAQIGIAEDGNHPGIAMNNNDAVTAIYESNGSLLYQAGLLWHNDSGPAVDFGTPTQYLNGYLPSIAMNNNGLVLEVHNAKDGNSDMWYSVGWIDTQNLVIGWTAAYYYDTGLAPAVAFNDQGVVVEFHQDEDDLLYHVGQLQTDKTIFWGPSLKYVQGHAPRVALDNDNNVIEIHQSTNNDEVSWNIGKVDGSAIAFQDSPAPLTSGVSPAVALNDTKTVIEVHQSEGGATRLWYQGGYLK